MDVITKYHRVGFYFGYIWASLVTQMLKNLSAMWETQVQSLDQEDPLKEQMATPCSVLAWRTPLIEEPGRLQSMGSQSQTQLSN